MPPAGGRGKGDILFREREYPPYTPKRTQGALPLDPAIASEQLEELHALRNQVRCTWLRHESLRIVTVLQPRLTIVRRE